MAFFTGKFHFLFVCYTSRMNVNFILGAAKDQMRADQLVKRRQQEHEQMEIKKRKIEEENRMQAIEEKFKAHYDAVEQMLKTDTVGLISLDEMKKKQEEIIRAREQQLAREKEAKLSESMRNKHNDRKDTGAHQRPNKLSFADEWEEEEEDNNNEPVIKKQATKNEEVSH
jgi:protein FAM50